MKRILVTGASSGMGRIIAKYLDEQGYSLVLVARSVDKLDLLKRELRNEAHVCVADLTELHKINDLFSNYTADNKLDGLVHCAGIGGNTPVRSNSIEDMAAIMTVNYFSFVELVKGFCNRKVSNEGAAVVALSSISPFTCYPGACNYAASKSAVNSAVKIMSKEYMKRKIRINAVLPAYVNTPLGPDENDIEYIKQQPLGIIKAEYIAYLVEFLLSDKAKYMTGTLIPVSGGMSY